MARLRNSRLWMAITICVMPQRIRIELTANIPNNIFRSFAFNLVVEAKVEIEHLRYVEDLEGLE